MRLGLGNIWEKDVPCTVMYYTKQKNLGIQNVTIKLDKKFNRNPLPEKYANTIELSWKKKCSMIPNLYNGSKFRLHSVEEDGNCLILNLGVTDYKDFQGTNLSEHCLSLQSEGLNKHGSSQAFLSDALGVGALVCTRDDHIVLIHRTNNVGEDRDLWDRPGGHPEPSVLVGQQDIDAIDILSLNAEAVRQELFNSIRNEVICEVNIPAESLSEPKILGLHRSNLNGGKPNAEFLINCSLSSDEVQALYKQGNQEEAFESQDIRLLPIQEVLSIHRNDPDMWKKMAPGAKAVFMLYSVYKQAYLS